ncbi:MAG: shikimate dehydrogenase [Kiritimatiellae bacterium]|jgi:shikimate dehydrogenase|nr:shikimate dehydrogenase [Kiritimatiellia bacterium]
MNFSPTRISPATRIFAVLGHPVAHSLSPAMHNPTLEAMGMDAVYLAFDVPPEELMDTLFRFAQLGLAGVNLTIPLKEVAFRNIPALSDTARLAGSVNTVVFDGEGRMEGHSTDGYGLRQALVEAFESGFQDREVMVLGCGGAGRAAALQAASDGASAIWLANRTRDRARSLASELSSRFPDVPLHVCEQWPPIPEESRRAALILQSTSMGMKEGDQLGLTALHFHAGQCVLDMTYVFKETAVMRVASTTGARVANGLGMLLHQGVRSLEIWTGTTIPVEVMRTALTQNVYGEKN